MKNQNLLLINYSEKSIAIFGDTKQFKEQFKELNGRFNPFLNLNGLKSSGWIFSKAKEDKLKEILNGLIETPTEKPVEIEPIKTEVKTTVEKTEVKKVVKKEVQTKTKFGAYFKRIKNTAVPICECLYFDKEVAVQNNLHWYIIERHNFYLSNKFVCDFVDNINKISFTDSVLINDSIKPCFDYNVSDFPTFELKDLKETININSNIILEAVKYVSSDDMRPNMQGVYIGNMGVSGTNGYKLYVNESIKTENNYILSADVLNRLPKNKDLTISFYKEFAKIEFDNIQFIIRLIDERFPDVVNVIPKNNTNFITVQKNELEKVVSEALKFANKTTKQIIFKLENNTFNLSSSDLDFNTEYNKNIQLINTNVSDFKFSLNGKILLEISKAIESEEIVFNFESANRAFLINSNVQIKRLLMPVLIN